jgi:hypothetical protein
MSNEIALCSIVTEAVREEFEILKFSFELFHGRGYQWFVRCDDASLPWLSAHPNLICHVFTEREARRPDIESREFRRIVAEKMHVLDDAWAAGGWSGVVFFDADVIATAPFMETVLPVAGDVVLTPNHYPSTRRHLAKTHGEFNAGFVFTRTPRFHQWWREAFEADPSGWTDQACLNKAPEVFEVGRLGPAANVGFWRSEDMFFPVPIPDDCLFLHAHLYQALSSVRELIDKSYSLHCMKYLHASRRPGHRELFNEISRRDRPGWFHASLRLSGIEPDHHAAAPASTS